METDLNKYFEIAEFLKKDIIKNMNMLYFLENNRIYLMLKLGNNVIMKGESDNIWNFISAYNEEGLKILLELVSDGDCFFAVAEDWMLPVLLEKRELLWNFSALRMYLPEDTPVLPNEHQLVSELKPTEMEFIYEHSLYKEYTSTDYIHNCMQNGISGGIRKNGVLAAWALSHDDGAIGFLHVLDEFRERGLGTEIMKYMITRTRQKGRIPFVHIEETNIKSLNLVKKLGFVFDRKVHWIAAKSL